VAALKDNRKKEFWQEESVADSYMRELGAGITRRRAEQLMREDFKRSGLIPEDLKALALSSRELGRAMSVLLNKVPKLSNLAQMSAAYIPYHDINGKVIEDHAALIFYAPQDVLNSLQIRKYTNFNPKQAMEGGGYEYAPPRFYLPPNLKGGWSEIARDVTQLIVEGQKKGACLCKEEIPAIGLEGVDNFMQRALQEKSFEPILAPKCCQGKVVRSRGVPRSGISTFSSG